MLTAKMYTVNYEEPHYILGQKHVVTCLPDAPVLELELLVRLDTAVMPEQVLQTMSVKCHRSWSLMRIEQTNEIYAEVPLQPDNVVVCPVKNLNDIGVDKNIFVAININTAEL